MLKAASTTLRCLPCRMNSTVSQESYQTTLFSGAGLASVAAPVGGTWSADSERIRPSGSRAILRSEVETLREARRCGGRGSGCPSFLHEYGHFANLGGGPPEGGGICRWARHGHPLPRRFTAAAFCFHLVQPPSPGEAGRPSIHFVPSGETIAAPGPAGCNQVVVREWASPLNFAHRPGVGVPKKNPASFAWGPGTAGVPGELFSKSFSDFQF